MSPFLICAAIWAASGASGFLVFLLIAPLGLIARVGWALYGPAPDLDAAEREIRSRGRGHRRHRERHRRP